MIKGYWIAYVTVTRPEEYAAYQALAPEALEAYQARFIARGGCSEALEGRSTPQRTVIIEFPSYRHAYDCFHSEAYQRARCERRNAADVEIVIVEGQGPEAATEIPSA